MDKIIDGSPDVQVVITRADLVQFLYPIRLDFARVDRRLENIERKLDRVMQRGSAPIVSLRRPGARR